MHVSYIQSERMDFIDDQLREIALALVKSELADLRPTNYIEAEEIISDELGPKRIGKIFLIRDNSGKVLFQSQGADILTDTIPQQPQWITFQEEDRTIRVLNLSLPKRNRTLQVATVLDANFMGWNFWNRRMGFYAAGVFALICLSSFFLASLVMRPFRHLQVHIQSVANDLSRFRPLREVPEREFRFALRTEHDEFGQLIRVFNRFIDRINWASRITRLWSMRLAHELKTPITLLRLEVEEPSQGQEKDRALLTEIDRMTKMVGDFLSWAEAGSESSGHPRQEISMKEAIETTLSRVDKLSPGRLSWQASSDWRVAALPEHLEQMILNLVENALKHTPESSPVMIHLQSGCLEVIDQGPGFPQKVLEGLGLPFNRGSDLPGGFRSSGIGLALVDAICRRYGWSLNIQRENDRTHVRIRAESAAS